MLLTGNGIFRDEILKFSHSDFACLMLISLPGFPRMKRNWLIVFLRKLPCWSVNVFFDPQGFDRTPNPKRDHNPWGANAAIYGLYRYVPLERGWFSSSLLWDGV